MAVALELNFVAFIDLLGFSEMVLHDCKQPPGKRKYVEKLKQIHDETAKVFSEKGYQITQFSDSIVISAPFNNEKNSFGSFVTEIADYQYRLFLAGFLCRGGVAHGKHFIDGTFLFSDGLIGAYHLESSRARFPRIILSDDLLDLVFPDKTIPSEIYILEESDGIKFIDYFKERNVTEVEGKVASLLSQTVTSDNVREKYYWLGNYFDHVFSKTISHPRFVTTA
ncbi:hypothetical protein EV683_10951 [Crenobacter luteus]|uniref:hypothetical protein n=1 Tax=Crenobacter luteus TaxID=1452487 RepID=UPI001045E69F|nr:hypothetical protein [Crenobacter luteus]TCP12457.1 hypothetical protein EV683_10951 [Crenobacter luteus]